MASVEELDSLFQEFDTRKHPVELKIPSVLRKASVLVPLFRKGGDWHVLLTLRSKHLRSHADTVSFPGGKADPQDRDEVATALREAKEEVGLNPEDVKVLAILPPVVIRPNNFVTPVVGIIPDHFVPNPHGGEVQKVFNLPLSRFLKKDYNKQILSWWGLKIVVHFFDDYVEGEKITTWGFTALMCLRVAMVILQFPDKRELAIGSPVSKENPFQNDWAIARTVIQNLTSSI